jgi:hypothetical protein
MFEFSTLKMTLKTHSTVKPTYKLHIKNVSVITPKGDYLENTMSLPRSEVCASFEIGLCHRWFYVVSLFSDKMSRGMSCSF